MQSAVRPGVRLGIDLGEARIGVARSDPSGLIATPVETVPRTSDGTDLSRIVTIAADEDAEFAAYLCSDAANCFVGQVFPVCGGWVQR